MAWRPVLRALMRLRSPAPIRSALATELSASRSAFTRGTDGWPHLERAHILSQPWAIDHVRVHAAMVRQGWHDRDRLEVRGQVVRLVVAGPGSLLNRYPIGNSGRAGLSATVPMPIIDADVRAALAAAGQPVDAE